MVPHKVIQRQLGRRSEHDVGMAVAVRVNCIFCVK